MIAEFALLVAALFIISKAASLVIDNAVILARYLKLSDLAIGFLIVSVATSLPELSIAFSSVLENAPGVSAGNVVGANVAVITYVIGIAALRTPFFFSRAQANRATNLITVAFLAPFLLYFFPGWISTLILLVLFAAFSWYSLRDIDHSHHGRADGSSSILAAVFLSFGIILLVLFSDIAVRSAVSLATLAGLSTAIIGATIVSLGTTLPELAVSLESLRKRNVSIALGNVAGSAFVNSTLVLGVASVSHAFLLPESFFAFALLALAISVVSSRIFNSLEISKEKGIVLVVCALAFIIVSFVLDVVL